MELLGINLGIFFQSPQETIGILVGGILILPLLSVVLDFVTQLVSDAMVKVNLMIIDRDWETRCLN